MRRVVRRRKAEPTVALINVVFLMLIFFLVAGTVAQPLDREIRLVSTRDLEGHAPPDALVLHPDGRLSFRGADQASAAAFLSALPQDARETVRIVPDRDVAAARLVDISRALRQAGAESVIIVTERAVP